ncbi:MAG: sigma-70 family RNA polymerase sigma factor [Gemmataceae bacterium]|nr:sigma-70 family RNA polymerase sigma factor [Gemmataceae bacterium]
MSTTPASLLERLKAPAPTPADWRRLHDLYRPLVRHWAGRAGLPGEADDIAQEVLIAVFRGLAAFERHRDGAFRAWLRTITVHKVRSHLRAARPEVPDAGGFLDRLADPAGDLSREWDRDHDRHVFDELLAAVRPDFTPPTWEAFRLFAVDGRSAAETAAATGLTENAVMLAKSRILKRLREKAAGLIDWGRIVGWVRAVRPPTHHPMLTLSQGR